MSHKPHEELMANSIFSTTSNGCIETKLLIDEKPIQNDISVLGAKKILSNPIVESNPNNKITTILHRLPPVSADVNAKGKSIFPHEVHILEEFHRQSISKEGKIKLVLKSLIQLDYYLAYIQMDGDPEENLKAFSIKEDNFNALTKRFLLFLDSKGLYYDFLSGLLANKSRCLTSEESYILIKEFQSLENQEVEISVKSRSIKHLQVNNENKPFSNELSIGIQSLTVDQQISLNENVDKIKSILKFFSNLESHIEYLRGRGWKINIISDVVIEPRGETGSLELLKFVFEEKKKSFEFFLEMNGVQFDSVSLELSKKGKILTLNQSMALLKEFCANAKENASTENSLDVKE